MDFIRSINGCQEAKESDLTNQDFVNIAFKNALLQYFDFTEVDFNQLSFRTEHKMTNPDLIRSSPLFIFKHIRHTLKRAGYTDIHPSDIMIPKKNRTLAAFNALDKLNRKQNSLKYEAEKIFADALDGLNEEKKELNEQNLELKNEMDEVEFYKKILRDMNITAGGSLIERERQYEDMIKAAENDVSEVEAHIGRFKSKVLDWEVKEAKLRSMSVALSNKVAISEQNKQLSISNQRLVEKVFECDASCRELSLDIEKIDMTRKALIKKIDTLKFRTTIAEKDMSDVCKEAKKVREMASKLYEETQLKTQQFFRQSDKLNQTLDVNDFVFNSLDNMVKKKSSNK